MANSTIYGSHIKSMSGGTANSNTHLSRVGGLSPEVIINPNARGRNSDQASTTKASNGNTGFLTYFSSLPSTLIVKTFSSGGPVASYSDNLSMFTIETSGMISSDNVINKYLITDTGLILYVLAKPTSTSLTVNIVAGPVTNFTDYSDDFYLVKPEISFDNLLASVNNYYKKKYTPRDVKSRTTVKTRKTSTALRDNKWNENTATWASGYPQSSDDTTNTKITQEVTNKVRYNYFGTVTQATY
jgi:hypothetical protein